MLLQRWMQIWARHLHPSFLRSHHGRRSWPCPLHHCPRENLTLQRAMGGGPGVLARPKAPVICRSSPAYLQTTKQRHRHCLLVDPALPPKLRTEHPSCHHPSAALHHPQRLQLLSRDHIPSQQRQDQYPRQPCRPENRCTLKACRVPTSTYPPQCSLHRSGMPILPRPHRSVAALAPPSRPPDLAATALMTTTTPIQSRLSRLHLHTKHLWVCVGRTQLQI